MRIHSRETDSQKERQTGRQSDGGSSTRQLPMARIVLKSHAKRTNANIIQLFILLHSIEKFSFTTTHLTPPKLYAIRCWDVMNFFFFTRGGVKKDQRICLLEFLLPPKFWGAVRLP